MCGEGEEMSEEIREQAAEAAPAEDGGVYDVEGIAAMFVIVPHVDAV